MRVRTAQSCNTRPVTRERQGYTMRRLARLSKRIRYARFRAPFLLRRARTTKQPIFVFSLTMRWHARAVEG